MLYLVSLNWYQAGTGHSCPLILYHSSKCSDQLLKCVAECVRPCGIMESTLSPAGKDLGSLPNFTIY